MFRKSLWIILILLAVLFITQAVLAQSAPDTIEMIGVIEAVGDGTLTVNGQVVQIGTAEITVALSAGQIVKIEGIVTADGSIVAREVQAPDQSDPQPDEIELTGQIESIDGDIITINGIAIDLSAAEITGTLEVGALVTVHASLADDGTLVAREVETEVADNSTMSGNEGNEDHPGEFEITGTLDEIGDGYIVVNGQRIEVASAEIKNMLVPGALVKLHLSNQDGQLIAREVENASSAASGTSSGHDDSSDGWEDTYTVQPGDTLSDIAARAGVTVDELAQANGITDTSTIVAGTQLLVPHEIETYSFEDQDSDNSVHDNSGDDQANSSPGIQDDDHNDDNSGSGSHNDDHSGSGSHNDDNSVSGSGHDNSGSDSHSDD